MAEPDPLPKAVGAGGQSLGCSSQTSAKLSKSPSYLGTDQTFSQSSTHPRLKSKALTPCRQALTGDLSHHWGRGLRLPPIKVRARAPLQRMMGKPRDARPLAGRTSGVQREEGHRCSS